MVLVSEAPYRASSDEYSTAWHQLRAELVADGFEVVVVSGSDGSTNALERMAHSARSFAAVRVTPEDQELAADVWIADPSTGKILLHRVSAQGHGREAARELALRTAELLEASVLVLGISHEEAPRPRRFGVWAGAGVFGHPGGVPFAATPGAGFFYRASENVAFELRLMLPATSEESIARDRAEIDQELGLLGLRFETALDEPMFVLASVGYGAYRIGARGKAAPPLVGRSVEQFVSAAAFGAGLGVRILKRKDLDLKLVIREDVIALMPRPVVVFAEAPLAKAGQPMLVASGGLELSW